MPDIKWQEVITSIGTAVGGDGVLLAVAAWLSKTIVTHRLAQDVEVVKTRLQTEANREIEKLRASLQVDYATATENLQLELMYFQ